MSSAATTAYCGPAPALDDLAFAWNLDATAIVAAIAILMLHRRFGEPASRRQLWFGVGVFLALFITPLCALTVSLFSARAVHHVMLIAVAAPLLALAFPEKTRGHRLQIEWLVGGHALVLWFWHIPQAYALGVENAFAYWAMQFSLLATGFLLWRRVFSPATDVGVASLALLATVVQMGMLGALLTFAQTALYAPHFSTTLEYGITPLGDQQLAGLVMWVPAAAPYLAAALWLFSRQLGHAEPR